MNLELVSLSFPYQWLWPIGRDAKSPTELQDGDRTVVILKISFKYIEKGDVGMTVLV